ncbi:MAG TPA: alpha/beta fold hydrolase [Steroidobacteraceae bacterium]
MTLSPDDFLAPRWLRNGHLQSILPSLQVRRPIIERRAARMLAASREILLDCGDGVRLQCFHSAQPRSEGCEPRSVVVLLHGWEGSAESLYILSLGQLLFENGHDVVRLNLRDHGATHHLNRELFHSCRLAEVVGAIRRLNTLFPSTPLDLLGFSLGGNFMLRVAAEAGNANLNLGRVIAVSPVLDPIETLHALEHGFALYHRYFIYKWTRSLMKKQAAWPQDYDFRDLVKLASLRHMTAEMVRRFTEFPTLEDYLNGYAITGSRLARLEVPSTVITASDDPIIPVGALERVARCSSLKLVVTRHGGHCGFLDGLNGPSWIERRVLAELSAGRAESQSVAIG